MESLIYHGLKTKEISFPIGGIGSGCIGLAGNGRLIDWEIFNRPNKGSVNGFSHMAIKAEQNGHVIDARVLNSDLTPPFTGEYTRPHYNQFGFGASRETLAGMPHFQDLTFRGEYPLAELSFIDDSFPANVKMTAFNPLIPLNDRDSSIPGAFFEISVTNTLENDVDYTVLFALANPAPPTCSVNQFSKQGDIKAISLHRTDVKEDDIKYGDLSIATDAADVSYQEYWYRGNWFDNISVYWRDFTSPGKFQNRTYLDTPDSQTFNKQLDTALLAAHFTLGSNQSSKVRFVLSWNIPNCHNYWSPQACVCSDGCCDEASPRTWRNYYTSLFENSLSTARFALENWKSLYSDTLLFKEALFSSTLPKEVLDAVSANISILKSPTCLRLEDGSFYGFEGCHCDEGCCEGSCTHVWNYAYALPFLFPSLERSMRDLDFKYNMSEDGGMAFRLQLPLGREKSIFRPCADGQFGGVIKAYRDWKICGNDQWIKAHWPSIKKNIEYAWASSNKDKWDEDKDGVLEGRQHHTLDMELFGPNSWLTGFYLAALRAAAEIAEFVGEMDTAQEYMLLFEKGKKWTNEFLFNGEYFHQKIDINDRTILEKFREGEVLVGGDTVTTYWNEEAQELKYQIDEGCGIDQVIAQWHSNLCGLGEVFHQDKTVSALKSIYKYNFKKGMRKYFNPCRNFCLNDESGVVICEWPPEKYKPVIPVPYAEETMYGYEYQVAIHMIQEGLVDEGLEIVRAIRDRFDGEKRNPWNEFECGSNYARSMASYALLNAFAGFSYDMGKNEIGFTPVKTTEQFRVFWSLDSGWGTYESEGWICSLGVSYGQLTLKKLKLVEAGKDIVKGVFACGIPVKFHQLGNSISFDKVVKLLPGERMEVMYGGDI